MKVVPHAGVIGFWQVAGPLLAADPVRNTVPLTIVGRILHGVVGDSEPLLLTVHGGPDVIAVAVRTPPAPIALGAMPSDAAVAIADYLVSEHIQVPGATGIRPAVEAFAAAWTERTGDEQVNPSDQRLYRLGAGDTDAEAALTPPTDVLGEPYEATEADVELLIDWRAAVVTDITGRPPQRGRAGASGMVKASLAIGSGQILWQVAGRPVAMAVVGVPREGMSRIGPVYTPRELRGHGYGSAVTAAAARWALDRGADHVVLFTDLANPVSNSIYQRIGFRPVADALSVAFRPSPTTVNVDDRTPTHHAGAGSLRAH
jgi:predicted GNAT family acetyltransferase